MAELTPIDPEKVAAEFPQSRFRILNAPPLAPGTCSICGSSSGEGRQFIDWGKQIDWYGAFYFCTFCFSEVAQLLGFVSGFQAKIENDSLMTHVANIDAEVEQLQEKLNAAMVLVRNCTCSDSGIGLPVVEIVEGSIVGDGDFGDEPESSNVDESSAGESDPVEGPDDIPADSGDDELAASGKPRRTRKSTG